MLNNNTDVTNLYMKNAKFLEYNSNVIPKNAGQEPLSVSLENLNDLNFSITDPHTNTITNTITNALQCIKCNKSRIYHFQNLQLPEHIQPATSLNVSISYIEIPQYSWFKHSVSMSSSNVFLCNTRFGSD